MEQAIYWLAGILTALGTIIGTWVKVRQWYLKRKEKKKQFEATVIQSLDDIKKGLQSTQEDVTMLMHDRLKTGHGRCMSQQWCPAEEKSSLLEMYDAYDKKGYNSLIASYAEDISHLPEIPPSDARAFKPM
jgi:hypothetical protein